MTVAAKTPEATQATATSPLPNTEQAFNWKHCWYPITFVQDLPKNRPYSFSLYDEPFVLFTNQDGKLSCLTDRCPHRAAKLSDGQIIDGKIECLYHGWQFDSEGQCLQIPQLPADAKIPINACVQSFTVLERQSIVWLWPGEPEAANEEYIPTLAALDKFGQSLPFYQGYSTSKRAGDNDGAECQSALSDRFSRHTQICSSCHRAYQVTNRLKQVSVGVAIALFSLAIVIDGFGMQIAAVSASLGAVAMAAIAENVKTKFERSYTRQRPFWASTK